MRWMQDAQARSHIKKNTCTLFTNDANTFHCLRLMGKVAAPSQALFIKSQKAKNP
ncbi:hypothetical protein H4J51_00020 [Colwellia sp. MB02u-18]|uniref:hypothetical protein n=1 Tax=unclassified Colwellia TaxID=196834 RepID=UPI0015F4D20F|nr:MULTISPECIES: hypothetical protein [unclassified Colwellia]MBA6222566.1 hypothetical protein [Colwellia sp. MB3u-45]MBA6265826.1 hypothetical protein [Colwellia sp. MB3u-43]MBA6319584.1 hypothetical protein [Colwellia sp. MB02u-19]MBA6322969.1 hypothetical protein [Colwellia sp. MB02u-18]MBA6329583.1 hypothetical protein [Colwellia sp. MB02u-12]